MAPPSSQPARPEPSQSKLLATGSLVQQAAQVTGLLAMFAILTVLARRLSLEELGVYGLLSSLAGYLLVIQNSAASAAVRNIAMARDDEARDRSFSTAAVVYAGAGVATGLFIAVLGTVLAAVVSLDPQLERQAQLGAVGLGAITAVGWPITVYRDAMRARQLFVAAALVEILAMVVFAVVVLGCAFGGGDLALLIAVSGAIPLLAGVGAFVYVRLAGLPFRLRLRSATRAEARSLIGLAWYVSIGEAAGTIIYALDRIILGVFRSAATVGLYEGPVRVHNVVRALNGALSVTVLPSASRYFAERDERRLAGLLTRGVRYTLGLIVPITVAGMVLAPDLLEVWLGGERFRAGGTALAILMSYWLVNGCSGVLQGIVVAGGRASKLAAIAWSVALANLAISLALTPSLGLEGVTIGTAVPYLAAFPVLLALARGLVPTPLGELVRHSFVPAYTLGAVLAVGLGAARMTFDLSAPLPLLSTAAVGVGGYWLLFYAIWFESHERRLVADVARGLLRRRSVRE